jgi:7,8-dihydroneopterin aldolase/epimerase/oxygenase
MDKIVICDLAVSYCVGVTDDERAKPQPLLITVEMMRDLSAAAASDDLADTIDYFAVSQKLLELGRGRSWNLLESLAVEIARFIKADYQATSVTIEVKKFAIPEARYTCVRVSR